MTRPLLAIAALAAGLGLAAEAGRAADLDYRTVPRERYGSAYEDPRYADIYGPSHQRNTYPHQYGSPYAERVPVPSEPVYRDPRYGDPRQYAEVQPPNYGHRTGCLSRPQVRRELERQGWSGFFDAEPRGEIAAVKARRNDGRVFALQVDRCSGEIVDARPLSPGYGPYAGVPRRYDPYY